MPSTRRTPPRPGRYAKALLWGAFFVWAVGTSPARATTCALDHADETVRVERVFDGDTVRLADGRHLRFIGLDTPEVAHDRRPAEPYADEAARAVQQLIAAGDHRLRLRHDAEAQDRYGRLPVFWQSFTATTRRCWPKTAAAITKT